MVFCYLCGGSGNSYIFRIFPIVATFTGLYDLSGTFVFFWRFVVRLLVFTQCFSNVPRVTLVTISEYCS